jgi:hypothetical protein
MLVGLTPTDVIIISPAAFVIGVLIGYVIRARYNGKED